MSLGSFMATTTDIMPTMEEGANNKSAAHQMWTSWRPEVAGLHTGRS